MIFSSKIYKIIDGENVSLYAGNSNQLELYIFNKSMKNYNILINSNKNCVFSKEYNYKKIIKLNDDFLCPASNDYITLLNCNDI